MKSYIIALGMMVGNAFACENENNTLPATTYRTTHISEPTKQEIRFSQESLMRELLGDWLHEASRSDALNSAGNMDNRKKDAVIRHVCVRFVRSRL